MERITINNIASGQPRAYADSRTITRVQWEHTPMQWAPYDTTKVKPEDIPWEPYYLPLSIAEIRLRRLGLLGTVMWRKDTTHGLESYIAHIKPINPKKGFEVKHWGPPDEELSDVWELYIVQPFTD